MHYEPLLHYYMILLSTYYLLYLCRQFEHFHIHTTHLPLIEDQTYHAQNLYHIQVDDIYMVWLKVASYIYFHLVSLPMLIPIIDSNSLPYTSFAHTEDQNNYSHFHHNIHLLELGLEFGYVHLPKDGFMEVDFVQVINDLRFAYLHLLVIYVMGMLSLFTHSHPSLLVLTAYVFLHYTLSHN